MATNHHCCVPQCRNDARYSSQMKLSFHPIPVDETLRREWITKVRLDKGTDLQITDSMCVCSVHFKADDFVETPVGVRKLVERATPSIFKWTCVERERPAAEQRLANHNATFRDNNDDCAPSTGNTNNIGNSVLSVQDNHVNHKTLEEKLEDCKLRVQHLETILAKQDVGTFQVERFTSDPQLLNFYTGFKDYTTFQAVFRSIQPTRESLTSWEHDAQRRNRSEGESLGDIFRNETLPLFDQFFMFLCRVKVGLFEQDLALRFNVSLSTVTQVCLTWANFLNFTLGAFLIWPRHGVVQRHMPECFRATYPKTRVILDCVEVKVQTQCPEVFDKSHSNYKRHSTLRGLVGITPSGAVSFISGLHHGGTSDHDITWTSGILQRLDAGDQVVVDKGFPIHNILQDIGCTLVYTPFLHEFQGEVFRNGTSSSHQIHVTKLQIHVESAIRRVREFHIFDGVIPSNLAGSVNQLWKSCCLLTNFKDPLH